MLQDADERRRSREQTGRAISGISTGIERLDDLLNGLRPGLAVLAGPPGVGKTSLSLQIALEAACEAPVVYVTYENSPASLVLKALCVTARVPPRDVQRGFANPSALRQAAIHIQPRFARLAIVEGTSCLAVAAVRRGALQAMRRHGAERCVVVYDYLQRAAHAQGYAEVRHNVSALAGELRDLANRLRSPVLAISSQNRAAGNYGTGGGSAALDSLKESGDLEYGADAVLFLRPNEERPAAPPARALDLVVAKNRDGGTGAVRLLFRPDIGDMREEDLQR